MDLSSPTPSHFLITLLVFGFLAFLSVHVLKSRRTVSSAIAWIGMIWLAPVFGALFYLLFGINRVKRRAVKARQARQINRPFNLYPQADQANLLQNNGFGDPDQTYFIIKLRWRAQVRLGERAGAQILSSHNEITLLKTGRETFNAMVKAIDEAQHFIALSAYIFQADQAGRPFIRALERAHKRGVHIHILVDAIGNLYGLRPASRLLRRMGVKIAIFNPFSLGWRLAFFNLRTHRKILICDETIAFTGGMNIRRHHLEELKKNASRRLLKNTLLQAPATAFKYLKRRAIIDRHFQVSGPIISAMFDSFAQDWFYATGDLVETGALSFDHVPLPAYKAENNLKDQKATAHKFYLKNPPKENNRSDPAKKQKPDQKSLIRAVSDGPDLAVPLTRTLLMSAISIAEREIHIRTPYFLPDQGLEEALCQASLRGVKIQILLPEHSNLPLFDLVLRANITSLLEAGVEIAFVKPPFEHSKLITIDRYWSLVGSSNWDARSLKLNFEFNLEVFSSSFARLLTSDFKSRYKIARPITLSDLDSRPLWHKASGRLLWLLSPYL